MVAKRRVFLGSPEILVASGGLLFNNERTEAVAEVCGLSMV